MKIKFTTLIVRHSIIVYLGLFFAGGLIGIAEADKLTMDAKFYNEDTGNYDLSLPNSVQMVYRLEFPKLTQKVFVADPNGSFPLRGENYPVERLPYVKTEKTTLCLDSGVEEDGSRACMSAKNISSIDIKPGNLPVVSYAEKGLAYFEAISAVYSKAGKALFQFSQSTPVRNGPKTCDYLVTLYYKINDIKNASARVLNKAQPELAKLDFNTNPQCILFVAGKEYKGGNGSITISGNTRMGGQKDLAEFVQAYKEAIDNKNIHFIDVW